MTIFALSTAPGRAAVAVIRVSGPGAAGALRMLTGREPPQPRHAALRRIVDPADGTLLDAALVLFFAGPRTETGEDMAEFQVHGGRAVVSGVLDALARLPGLRPAEPGEFTRRAVANGKIDLTAAEAVADLVDADTARQREQALAEADGAAARRYDGWRDALIGLMARLEAAIDFSDEDLPDGLLSGLEDEMTALAATIRAHLDDEGRAQRLREGLRVVILGAPNAGKSSLLNRLARREAAIVAEEAGTTRDIVEVTLDIGGFAVTLSDTAGLRQGAGAIEAEGMRRARALAGEADLRLILLDATRWAESRTAVDDLLDERALIVVNKTDLARPPDGESLAVSCANGEGLDTLVAAIAARLESLWRPGPAGPSHARHRAGLEQAVAALELAAVAGEAALAAEDLRLAATALGRLTGRVDVEDILDAIFARFCIGK